jgi:hypothetical protein
MPEEPTNVLIQFIRRLQWELENNHLTPSEALRKIESNGYLRRQLQSYTTVLTLDTLRDPEQFKARLINILAYARAQQEVRYGKVSPEDILVSAITPAELTSRAKALENATSISYFAVKRQRKKFIESLVSNLTKQYALSIQSQMAIVNSVDEMALTESREEVSRKVSAVISRIPEITAVAPVDRTKVEKNIIQTIDTTSDSAALVSQAIIRHTGPRPDALAAVVEVEIEKLSAVTPDQVRKVIEHAEPASRMYEAFTADGVPALDTLRESPRAPFAEAYASNPAVGRAVDSIVNAVNTVRPGFREEFQKQVIGDAFREVTKDKNKAMLAKRLGPEFVESSVFQQLKEDGQKEYGIDRGRVGLWVSLTERIAGTPKEAVVTAFELQKLGVTSARELTVQKPRSTPPPPPPMPGVQPTVFSQTTQQMEQAGAQVVQVVRVVTWRFPDIYYAMVNHGSPDFLSMNFLTSIKSWFVGWGKQKVVEKGVEKGAQALAGFAAKKATGAAVSAVTADAAAGAGLAVGGPIGAAIGWLVGTGVGKLVGKIAGAAKGAAAFILGQSTKNDGKIFAWMMGGALIFILVFGLFNSSTTAIFNQGARGGGETGSEELANFKCDPPPTYTPINKCPVEGGSVTQGPFGSFSHQGEDAYDIALPIGRPVYAAHTGYVVAYADGAVGSTGFGRFVKLVGRTSDGKPFITTYGHLLSINSNVKNANRQDDTCKNNPTLINQGEIIGYVDSTGNVYPAGAAGSHLHYQYDGPGHPGTGCGYNF